jgi:muramoyltetrapeptide carboxypeptidase
MIQPAFLQKGDTLAIIAPARKYEESSISTAIQLLESWGLHIKVGSNVFNHSHSYLSSSDENRATDFQHAIDDDTVKAILCARGGYGCTRIIDQLNFSNLIKNPKWVIGFSDVTAIHLQMHSLGLQSIHATMPVLFSNEHAKDSLESLRQLLFGKPQTLSVAACAENRSGIATGLLLGGNLSLLVDSLGTPSEPEMQGKILIIEEVDEYFYKLDRMFVQLKRSGKLSSLAGLAIGYFTDIKESTLPFGESVMEIVNHHTREYDYPLAFNFPIGHAQPNMAWIEGANITLTVGERGSKISYTKEDTSA